MRDTVFPPLVTECCANVPSHVHALAKLLLHSCGFKSHHAECNTFCRPPWHVAATASAGVADRAPPLQKQSLSHRGRACSQAAFPPHVHCLVRASLSTCDAASDAKEALERKCACWHLPQLSSWETRRPPGTPPPASSNPSSSVSLHLSRVLELIPSAAVSLPSLAPLLSVPSASLCIPGFSRSLLSARFPPASRFARRGTIRHLED